MVKKLYVFGNEYLENDSFAGKIASQLQNKLDDVETISIIRCTSPDDLLDADDDITILDVVKNIKEPILITDISKLKINNMVSLHDFDLAYFLNLMKELDMNKNIRIIGIPMRGINAVNLANEKIDEKILDKVKLWI